MYIHKGKKEGWLLVGVLAQWQSTGMVSQRPWFDSRQLHLSFKPFASHFQRSTDSNGQLKIINLIYSN